MILSKINFKFNVVIISIVAIVIIIISKLYYKIMDKNPGKQIESLAGKIDKSAMGQRYAQDKPKKQSNAKKDKKKQKGSEGIKFKEGNVFRQKFDDSVIYRPKTQQNKLKYDNFLGRINSLAQDYSQEVLVSLVDEILAILKSSESETQKKNSIQLILGQKMPQQLFLDLINIARTITDYDADLQNNQEMEIAIGDDDQSDEDDSQGGIIQEEEVEHIEEDNPDKNQQDDKAKVFEQKLLSQTKVNPSLIDAHWLQSQLNKHFDVATAQQLQGQILNILNSDTKLEVQNGLLNALNYQNYSLIKLLLDNREVIYYCTKYHQTRNQKQKEQILQSMKQRDISLTSNNSKKNEKRKQIESKPEIKQEMGDDQNIHLAEFVKDEEIHRINKKIIDLNIHDQKDHQGVSKQQYKFKLPQGADKAQKPGYQQIRIPPSIRSVANERLIDIESLPSWMHPAFTGIKRLNTIQSHVCEFTLKTNKNMLVCAPTSAGKTNIALMAILRTMSQFMNQDGYIDISKFKIVYIAPMKALVAQITGNLTTRLKDLGVTVKQLTGDMHLSKAQIEETQVIVSTPEKWDIVTRKAGDRIFTQIVRLMIIDQIHLLSDSRGPVLESLIARMIRQSENSEEHVRIVGLSATLPNYRDVGATLRVTPKNGLFYFDQSYRPVPLQQLFCGVTQKKGVRKMMMVNQILYEKVIERVSHNQMIIFVHSRRDTARTAKYIKQTAYTKNQSHRILRPQSESKKILQEIVQESTDGKQNKINNADLKQLLSEGIGIHHAGLSRSDRDYVEQLFADRHLNILVSTATLAWGVNLPAHTVIIKGTQVYSAQQGRWIELTLQDIMQMLGRAGRPRYDEKGQGIIISGYEQIRYYLGLLNMQVPLESQMLRSLPDQLNAEIVLGAVNSLKDGVNWLGYTYLYIRMLRNPKYYSISLEELQQDPQLLKRRVNLIHSAATILQKNGLINYDRRSGIFNSTYLGKICSYYYVKYSSMSIYNTNLKPTSSLIDLFKIFSMSSQFRFLTVRDEEKNELSKLIQSVPIPIKGSVDEITSKISVLLQAHISRLQLEGYALNVDKVYVTQSASRIMRALFQICIKRGWGQIGLRCLQVAKMIDKSMWGCMNPLRQFKAIPEYVLSRLQKKEQFSWESFYQMSPQQIGDLTKFQKLGKILHKFVHHVPRVQINAYAQPITRSCLKVQLNVKIDFRWDDELHGRQQPFWLFVLDCNEENILFSYHFTLSRKEQVFYIQFIVPLFEVLHPLYFIKICSDRWVSSDNTLPLSFKNMYLPHKFPAPNQVLDLQPLPQSNLLAIAKDMKISYLNQIQTQVYNSFVNSDENVFLGATEGSGKFTLAVFSVAKYLQKGKKSVIIFSHKEILKNKFEYLQKIFGNKVKIGITKQNLALDSAILASSNLILTTCEAWDVLTRRWKVRKGFSEIGLIVIDNLHMMGEKYSTMEVIVSRMRYVSVQLGEKAFKIIGLAASVANYQDVGQWIGVPPQNMFNFHPNIRQNRVQIVFSSYDQTIRESRLHMMQKNIINNVKHYNRNAIVFVSDRKQAKLTSLDFVSLLAIDVNPKKFRKIPDEQMKVFASKISDQYLVHILEYGIGYVYEGMSEVQKQIVLKLFEIQGIGILVASQEIKWEIALKSFIVAILDCSYYNCRNARWTDYSIPQMVHMMGLAATSQKDKNKGKQYSSSKFLIMCHGPKKNYYKKFLFEPLPVESSLNLNLANHLVASISIKSIQSKQGCLDWLTWTFLYRRLTQNPNYYNMQEISEEGISTYLSELIENTVEYLQGVKCIEVENQMDLSATNLGIISSYYYIKIETVGTFVEKVTENIKLKPLLELISQAEELKDCSFRPGQFSSLSQLLLQTSQASPINKAHALLLLHLHRVAVPGEILKEIKSILPIFVTLTQTLVDIISSFGYLKPLILCMQIHEMLIQAMWVYDSKLLQVMDRKLAHLLEDKYKITDITDFVNMDDNDRETACKGKDIDRIAMLCNRYPNVEMQCQLKLPDAEEEEDQEELEVTVKLTRDEQLEDYRVIAPYYPVDKQQCWWIVIGDKNTNRVLTTKRTTLKVQSTVSLSFQKIENCKKYTVYALCDSYIGCDLAEEISLPEQ